ncbi:hypothetical protein WDU94_012687 [Cyamophila willieti]
MAVTLKCTFVLLAVVVIDAVPPVVEGSTTRRPIITHTLPPGFTFPDRTPPSWFTLTSKRPIIPKQGDLDPTIQKDPTKTPKVEAPTTSSNATSHVIPKQGDLDPTIQKDPVTSHVIPKQGDLDPTIQKDPTKIPKVEAPTTSSNATNHVISKQGDLDPTIQKDSTKIPKVEVPTTSTNATKPTTFVGRFLGIFNLLTVLIDAVPLLPAVQPGSTPELPLITRPLPSNIIPKQGDLDPTIQNDPTKIPKVEAATTSSNATGHIIPKQDDLDPTIQKDSANIPKAQTISSNAIVFRSLRDNF